MVCNKKKVTFPISFDNVNVVVRPKPGEDKTRKRKLPGNIPNEHGCEHFKY